MTTISKQLPMPTATASTPGAMSAAQNNQLTALASVRVPTIAGASPSSVRQIGLDNTLMAMSKLNGQVVNVALGCGYTCSVAPHASYPDSGGELTNGYNTLGSPYGGVCGNVGWPGDSIAGGLNITLDLRCTCIVGRLRFYVSRGLSNVGVPAAMTVSVSQDGTTFHAVSTVTTSTMQGTEGSGATIWIEQQFAWRGARYVRLSITPYDANHWIFCGEVEVYGFRAHPAADVNLVVTGDSLTAEGQWLGNLLAEQVTMPAYANVAVGGKTIQALITDDVTRVDPLFDAAKTNVLFVWAGTNDLANGASSADVEGYMQTYCAARRTVGWQIIVGTILPRSNVGLPGSFETDRQSVNTWLRANYAGFADQLDDVGANPSIGAVGASADANLYWDLIHLTNLGFLIRSSNAAAAYANLLTALST